MNLENLLNRLQKEGKIKRQNTDVHYLNGLLNAAHNNFLAAKYNLDGEFLDTAFKSAYDGSTLQHFYMNYSFPFEKLVVWHDARNLVIQIYSITKSFPETKKFGLTNQINRAAVSVASNLAEGSSRTSLKDQAHFSQVAYSSLMELACQISIAQELNFIDGERYDLLRRDIEVLSKKLNALRNSQLKRQLKN